MVTTARKQELIKKDLAHFFRVFGVVGEAPKVIWERGEGTRVWDIDGKQYIDMTSGGAQYMNLGWGRKELIDAAHEQMQKISHISAAGGGYSSEVAIEYATELAEVLPGDINHVLFTLSGTDCTEAAVKIARFYWNLHGQAGKYKVLCLSDAYHGVSHFAASILGVSLGRAPFGVEFPGIVRIPNYYCYRCPYGLKYPSCNMLCARMVERTIEQEGEETIACMIAEPIQGYAGFIWPPDEYWPIVRKICSDHNILLIADEVQNGFCRTGKFWGMDNWNVVPDIMTMGKGINSCYLPLGAVGISDKVYKDFIGHSLLYGATSFANPVVLATGRAALKIYKEEKLAQRSAKLGEHIHHRLVEEFLSLPCVDNVLGKGCYQSFEIALNKTTGHKVSLEEREKVAVGVGSQLLEKGVIPPVVHGMRMAVTPPLTICEDDLDTGLDIMLSVMKEVKPV